MQLNRSGSGFSRTCERRPARRSSEGDTKFDAVNDGSNLQNGASRHIEKAGAIPFSKMKLPSQSFTDAPPWALRSAPTSWALVKGLFKKAFSNSLTRAVNEDWRRIVLSMLIAGPYCRPIAGALIVSGLCGGAINLYNGFEFCRILLKQR